MSSSSRIEQAKSALPVLASLTLIWGTVVTVLLGFALPDAPNSLKVLIVASSAIVTFFIAPVLIFPGRIIPRLSQARPSVFDAYHLLRALFLFAYGVAFGYFADVTWIWTALPNGMLLVTWWNLFGLAVLTFAVYMTYQSILTISYWWRNRQRPPKKWTRKKKIAVNPAIGATPP